MKKNNLLILIFIIAVIAVGCKPTVVSEKVDMDNLSNPELTISDYFPFIADTIYDYV